jgi:enoyl-CoA hydratase
MSSLVRYQLHESIATITMDDGKVNVLSPRMLADLNSAFDRAEAERAVVVLGGRAGVFSAGFDLPVLRAGTSDAREMLVAGFELSARILAFPRPVVVACTGHAIAMGFFLLLSGDYRVGAAGPFKLTANEVAIGLTVPFAAVEICRQRLNPAHFNRAVILAEPFAPEDAVDAGIFDRVVPAPDVDETARATAALLTTLDLDAHAATKLRARDAALLAIRAGIDAEFAVQV